MENSSKNTDSASKCYVCDKTFFNKYNLQKQTTRKHSTTPVLRFACELCPKTYLDKGTLNRQIISYHPGQRPFICNFCPKAFSQSNNLYSHIRRIHKKSNTPVNYVAHYLRKSNP